jgi:hypothetical protein
MFERQRLIENSQPRDAAIHITGSFVVGLLAGVAGHAIRAQL